MIRVLIKPLMRIRFFKILVQFSYVVINRMINYNKIRRKIKSPTKMDVSYFNYKDHDTFFGYYDKCPINSSQTRLVFHASPLRTYFKPNPNQKIKIIVQNLQDNSQKVIAETSAYNWQQGSRLQWISDNEVLFNDYCNVKKTYISHCYNAFTGDRIKTFDFPVQDAYFDQKFYSINYNRLRSLRPDYGYFNSTPLSSDQLKKVDRDGIWEIDYKSGKGKLLISIEEVINTEKNPSFDDGYHWLNHVMISPDGKRMVFLHRCNTKNDKKDRMFSFDLQTRNLDLIINYAIVSHFNWIDNNSLICFNGQDDLSLAYKKINISTKEIIVEDFFKQFNLIDGHPTFQNRTYLTDTYPNILGFQKLILATEGEINVLHETYHPILYFKETRCDLHPRIHQDKIFFDQIINGQRKLSVINCPKLINQ